MSSFLSVPNVTFCHIETINDKQIRNFLNTNFDCVGDALSVAVLVSADCRYEFVGFILTRQHWLDTRIIASGQLRRHQTFSICTFQSITSKMDAGQLNIDAIIQKLRSVSDATIVADLDKQK